MSRLRKITPCLWFDDDAEDAVAFYTGIFENSRIIEVSRYGKAGQDVHGHKPGSVMTIAFELDGQTFTALNGGPQFKFTEAISLQVVCASQQEIDYFWQRLTEGGDPQAQQCGWLKDKFGVSWQVFPERLMNMFADAGSANSERAFAAMMQMKKFDLAALERAYAGNAL
jgi:predicted 3-demethylubiquinone-9 3-methyltransferase (glyoxalase superfamily)